MAARTALVIDDEPQIRRVVRHALADDFGRILEADTGGKGIDLAAAERPALVVLASRWDRRRTPGVCSRESRIFLRVVLPPLHRL